MVVAIQLEAVSKTFWLRESRSAKDLVLGIKGHRPAKRELRAVDSVSFTVQQGESVALLGPNGSGKSTTLKMMAGVVGPSAGTIRMRGRVVPLLELGAGFHPDLTGRENVFLNGAILGIPRRDLQSSLDEIVDFAGVEEFIDTPVKFYSSGMAVRLGFAIAVNVSPDVLLVDEVLAVGDESFKKKSLERMREFRSQGVTIMLVTHDRSMAVDFCERGLSLQSGRLVFDGAVEQVP